MRKRIVWASVTAVLALTGAVVWLARPGRSARRGAGGGGETVAADAPSESLVADAAGDPQSLLRRTLAEANRLLSTGKKADAYAIVRATAAAFEYHSTRLGDEEKAAGAAAADPAPALVAAYEMEPDPADLTVASDAGPLHYNGSVEGSALFVDGHTGKGISFDGQTGLVRAPTPKLTDVALAGLTLSAWVNPKDVESHQPLISKRTDSYTPGPFFFSLGPGGSVEFSGQSAAGNYDFRTPVGKVKAGQWAHVAVTFGVGKGVVFYVDGAVAARFGGERADGALIPNQRPLVLGADWPLSDVTRKAAFVGYRGVMDAAHIYATELTAEQIRQDMVGGLKSKRFAGLERAEIDRRRREAQVAVRVAELIAADLRLAGGDSSQTQWAAECEKAFAAAGDAGEDVAVALVDSMETPNPDQLWQLVRLNIPSGPRAALALTLSSRNASAATASAEACRRFYDELIALTVDSPEVAESLLVRYVQELDRRAAAAEANELLEGFTQAFADTDLGARAALLRVDGEPPGTRDVLVERLSAAGAGSKVARSLRFRRAHALARQDRFLDALRVIDDDGRLDKAREPSEVLVAVAHLSRRGAADPSLVSGRSVVVRPASTTAPAAAPVAAPPERPLRKIGAIELCQGAAAELAGADGAATAFASLTGAGADVPATTPAPGSLAAANAYAGGAVLPSEAKLLEALKVATARVPAAQMKASFVASALRIRGASPAGAEAASAAARAQDGDDSQRLYRLNLQANVLAASRKYPEAAERYQTIIKEFPANAAAVNQARRSLVKILLAQDRPDVGAAETQIAALTAAAGNTPDDELWNARLRLLCHKAAAVAGAERAKAWSAGIADLAASAVGMITPAALADADHLASAGGDGAPDPAQIWTDLLLLVPDTRSMRAIQAKRLAVYEARGDWNSALAAADLDMALATAAEEGPAGPAARYASLLVSAEASAEERGAFEQRATTLTGASAGAASAGKHADTLLATSAARWLQGNAKTQGPAGGAERRHAFLSLFAGNPADAVRAAHAALAAAPLPSERVFDAFDDVAVVLAAADGDVANSPRFGRWMAGSATSRSPAPSDPLLGVLAGLEKDPGEHSGAPSTSTFAGAPGPARAEIAKSALARWGRRCAGWGLNLLGAGDAARARAYFSAAINSQATSSQAQTLVDEIVRSATEGRGDREALAMAASAIESAAPSLVDAAARGYAVTKALAARREPELKKARALMSEGKFDQCLAALDGLDQAVPEPPGAQDANSGFLRAMCLLRLNRQADAVALLTRMEGWRGTPEEHARCAFLIGWTYLQNGEDDNAKPALKRVTEKYPQTSFVEKATRLLESLE